MLSKTSAGYYRETPDLNCAEAMLHGGNKIYQLDLEPKAVATMSTFGGGMGVGSVCGALTGGLAALGVMLREDESIDKAGRSALAAEYYRRFEQRVGATDCPTVMEKHWNSTSRCEKSVAVAAEILEELVSDHLSR